MVKDLILDMGERDLLAYDRSNPALPVFDTVWGEIFDEDKERDFEALICNIIIPEGFFSAVEFTDGELEIRFKSEYIPQPLNFRIRLVAILNGTYHLFSHVRGQYGFPANSFVLSKNIAAPIKASFLPLIDIEGEFIAKLVINKKEEVLDKAYVYSSKSTDIHINYSDDQASQLLSLCAPGNSYRYPTTGVGITNYLNSVVDHSDLYKVLEEQFDGDRRSIQEAEFDNETGKLNVLFYPEKEQVDSNLTALELLDGDFFTKFNDEYVRRNIVLSELADNELMKILNTYPDIKGIFLFTDQTTSTTRVTDTVVPGKFNGVGEIEPSDEYYIVTASLSTDTIIMFDDETEDDVKDAPIFIINENDETRLYTALVEQPYWLTESCHRCFILKHRATISYMISQEQFRKGKGLFTVHYTSDNIKNMLALVQDVNTGRLIGIVSDNTNISDLTLDEITQHIYATQIN